MAIAKMNRDDLEKLSKPKLVELVLRLQRPTKTSRTSSKPPSTDKKARRKKTHTTKANGRNYNTERAYLRQTVTERAARNRARALMVKAGKAKKGDKKDVAHKDNNTKNGKRSNLKMQSKTKNRSFARNKNSSRKKRA